MEEGPSSPSQLPQLKVPQLLRLPHLPAGILDGKDPGMGKAQSRLPSGIPSNSAQGVKGSM